MHYNLGKYKINANWSYQSNVMPSLKSFIQNRKLKIGPP